MTRPLHLGQPVRLAAMDLGTNSFHLIVADVRENGRFTVLGREKEPVRLGEGITDMKHLGGEAVGRALAVLARFALIAETHGASVRAVATSAVREALNQEEFVEIVRRRTGIAIEVVSGVEEARLIYLGVLQALPVYNKRVVLVDIGGGSTEFLLGRAGKVEYANSLKIGAVRLTQRFFTGKTLRADAVAKCRTFLRGELHPIRRALRDAETDVFVGCSGTILAMASIVKALAGEEVAYDANGVVFTRKELAGAVEKVLDASTIARRRRIPGLDAGRADIIIAGALILEAVFENLGIDRMTTSKYALREGILLDSIRKLAGEEEADAHLRDIRRSSVLHLAELCRYESAHAHYVTRLALDLFDQTRDMHGLAGAERELLEAAGLLHDIGYHISHAQHHLHAHYIIANSELLGFTEREKEIVGSVARYHRKSHPKDKHEHYAVLSQRDRAVVQKLAAILRIADGLDRRHKGMFVRVDCMRRARTMRMRLHRRHDEDVSVELWGASRRKELFESLYHCDVIFEIAQ